MGSVEPVPTFAARWGLDPDCAAAGFGNGIATGLWRFPNTPVEVDAEPLGDMHIISPFMAGSVDQHFFIDGRERYHRRSGTGVFNLVRAGERPRAVSQGVDHTVMLIFLPDALVQSAADDGRPVELRPIGLEKDRVVTRVGRLIGDEMRHGDPASRLMIEGLSLQLAAHLVRHWSDRSPPRRPERGSPLAGWRLRRVTDRLTDDLAAEPSLAELAALVGLSPTHLCRAFAAATGLPPHRWLARHRIERARQLLDQSDLRVADIAAAVGFADPAYFARAFKRATGLSPLEWRIAARL